ncbi:hypothetical protein ASPZODRAFT_152806 [Penicilliopsis zonata CBS 506.65]|uniref:L-ornithine N(5)-oxygenase n=1 Tax=Penicilliopsis zonata CBS 506.65 TaxID=1073090 RepID=A0A1L9SF96_9EURO|nr:hypothetical protein ASPZODRAFT_152806 [Penicilliopsis zonata CBS 506.65]OJJ45822.1 hypothetical protein ASPZODRAFT_152806 [Penicilliopsis zonata CBS 506.65]
METDTIIIGNGPSAMILSYILHGHIPLYSPDPPHPDPLLHAKLKDAPELLNICVDTLTQHFAASRLSYSTQALPVNVLLDTLVRPSADIEETESTSNVQWRFMPEKAVPHLVFGNAPQPGGQWTENPMPASWEIQTLSYAAMLSLPGYSYAEHYRKETGKDLPLFTRPSRREVAEYLCAYPAAVHIDKVFRNGETVADISRTANGFYIHSHNIHCKRLVLASGIFSELVQPSPLMIPLAQAQPDPQVPFLIIGSGFSAADVIISAPDNQKILHIFKWNPDTRPSPLRGCHQQAYPEYAGVYRLMKRAAIASDQSAKKRPRTRRASSTPFLESRCWDQVYEGLANVEIVRVDMRDEGQAMVTFQQSDGTTFTRLVRGLAYAVGRRGTLGYLNEELRTEVLGCPIEETGANPPVSGQTLRSKAVEGLEVAPSVFIMGSLTGDSLIRFAYGGCVYTAGKVIRAYTGEDISTPSRPATATALAVMNGMDGHHIRPEMYGSDDGKSMQDRMAEPGKPGFVAWWHSLLRLWR